MLAGRSANGTVTGTAFFFIGGRPGSTRTGMGIVPILGRTWILAIHDVIDLVNDLREIFLFFKASKTGM